MEKIRYLKNAEIDKQKWNQTIENAANGLIYGTSYYLDIVCQRWDALVAGDYDYILPLPVKKKSFIEAINKPSLIHRLNVFSQKTVNDEIILHFLEKIPKKFVKVFLNIGIENFSLKTNYRIAEKNNYVLSLNDTYDNLYKKFSKSHRRNIINAIKNNVLINKTSQTDNFLLLIEQLSKRKEFAVEDNWLSNLKKIAEYNIKHCGGVIYEAYFRESCVAAALFARFQNRYTLFSASNIQAREVSAFFLLMDRFIADYSQSDTIVDFAGSMIPSIAERNKGFGAEKKIYLNFQRKILDFLGLKI